MSPWLASYAFVDLKHVLYEAVLPLPSVMGESPLPLERLLSFVSRFVTGHLASSFEAGPVTFAVPSSYCSKFGV